MAKDQFTKQWIIENSLEIIPNYDEGQLTIRALHYKLVGRGMTNDIQHYKRVVSAMESARWDGLVTFKTFSDLDREMVGETEFETTDVDDKIEEAKNAIRRWMTVYYKNTWENQAYYPEVFIEKKALQGVFEKPCRRMDVTLGACKGYPSLTFLNNAAKRFSAAVDSGKKPVILYFGGYDPSGEDIPRSIEENLARFGVDVEVRRIALMEHQVKAWKLPHAPAKDTDSRTKMWDGIGQVELDAVDPNDLVKMCSDAIKDVFDQDAYNELRSQQEKEKEIYVLNLKEYVSSL